MSDELERLNNLHKAGALSDREFAQAKSKLLGDQVASVPVERADYSNYSNLFWIVLAVIGAMILASVLFGVALPRYHGGHHFLHW